MFSQLFTQMAGTWLSVESVFFRNPDFWPKIHFLNATPFFSKDHRRSWTWAPHRHWTRPEIFFVSNLGHFSLKSLTHPHYGVLSVSNKPARAGLDKRSQIWIKAEAQILILGNTKDQFAQRSHVVAVINLHKLLRISQVWCYTIQTTHGDEKVWQRHVLPNRWKELNLIEIWRTYIDRYCFAGGQPNFSNARILGTFGAAIPP